LDPNDAIDEDATVEACGYEATASRTDFSCADIGTPVMVDIFVIDPSGNIDSCMATITVVDVNGPVLTCPDDQTVSPEATGVYTLEDFTGLATATDGCDGNVDVISQSPAPGAQLGVGTYTITMTSTDSMGNDGTCTFELTVDPIAGVGESELSAAIALYPNPASEFVNLSNNSSIALERAAIYNVNGQLVNDVNLDGMIGERTIDVSSLASGVYMVQISGENNVVVKRL
ncbi:T9SS type A sorting domain-containing protein, partial [Jejudonia soesokkakensis]